MTIRFSLSLLFLCSILALCHNPVQGSLSLDLKMQLDTDSDLSAPDWEVYLNFSRPVSAEELRGNIQVKGGENRNVPVNVNVSADGRQLSSALSYTVSPKTPSMTGTEITVQVMRGLMDSEGVFPLIQNQQISFRITRVLEVNAAAFKLMDDNSHVLALTLNGHLPRTQAGPSVRHRQNMNPRFNLIPAVYTWHRKAIRPDAETEIHEYSGQFGAGQRWRLEIPRHVASGAIINQAVFDLRTPDFPASIRLQERQNVIELHGPQRYPVEVMNLQEIACQLTRLPPASALYFALHSDNAANGAGARTASSDAGASGARTASSDAGAAGARATSADAGASGREITLSQIRQWLDSYGKAVSETGNIRFYAPFIGEPYTERLGFLARSTPNSWSSISIPLNLRKNPGQGGIFLLQAGCSDNASIKTSPTLQQITDIGITWKKAYNSMVIWLTSLDTGRPVSNASILIGLKDGTVARAGRSNTEGLIILEQGQTLSGFPAFAARATFVAQPDFEAQPSAETPIRKTMEDFELNIQDIQFILATDARSTSMINTRDRNLHIRHHEGSYARGTRTSGVFPSPSGHIIMDRGIWRPGDTIYFKAFLRKLEYNRKLAPLTFETVEIQLLDPTGSRVYNSAFSTSSFGTLHDSITVENRWKPGVYALELQHQGQVLHSARAVISEFRQPRHHVDIDGFVRHNRAEFTISSRYMAGGPLSGAQTRWKASLVPARRPIPNMPDYVSGSLQDEPREVEAGEATLDSDGQATITLPVDNRVLSGAFDLRVDAFVVDFDGRDSSASTSVSTSPEYLLGTGRHPGRVLASEPVKIPLIITDSHGNKLICPEKTSGMYIQCEILSKSWMWTTERDSSGRAVETWQNIWKRSGQDRVPVKDGKAEFRTTFEKGGEYRLSFSLYLDGQALGAETGLSVDGPGMYRESGYRGGISLKLDKDRYSPGDTAHISVWATAEASQALLSLEGQQLFGVRTVPLTKDPAGGYSGSTSIQIEEYMAPNLWLTALAPLPRQSFPVYRSDTDDTPPGALSGHARIDVTMAPATLDISARIGAPGKSPGDAILQDDATSPDNDTAAQHDSASARHDGTEPPDNGGVFRPGETVEIELHITDGGVPAEAEVMLSVVDEGVLWLTRYRLPDLFAALDLMVPLSVITGDLRGSMVLQVLDMMGILKPLTGGDAPASGMEEQILLRQDFSPVAIFKPDLKTDEHGRIRVSFRLPDTLTSWQISVVASDRGDGFGTKTSRFTTSLPFSIEPGIPAFLVAGDESHANVMAINRTNKDANAEISVLHSKGLTVSPAVTSTSVKAQSRDMVDLNILAANMPVEAGELKLSAHFTGSDEDSGIEKDIEARQKSFQDAISVQVPVLSSLIMRDSVQSGINAGEFTIYPAMPDYLTAYLAECPSYREPDSCEEPGAHRQPGLCDKTVEELWLMAGKPEGRLIISSNPAIAAVPAIKYLKNYRYGCAEQVSSRLAALSASLYSGICSLEQSGLCENKVRNSIKKDLISILDMQVEPGIFGFWPGSIRPSPIGTVYALWALYQARQAGFFVPDTIFEKGASYLAASVAGRVPELEGQAEYVLALLGYTDLPPFTSTRLNSMSREGSAWALAAQARIARNSSAGEELKPELARLLNQLLQMPASHIPGYFSAPAREKAAIIIAMHEIDPQNPRIGELYSDLISMMKDGRWISTAVSSWCVIALCRDIHNTVTDSVNTKNNDIMHNTPLDWQETAKGSEILVQATDKPVYWSMIMPYPIRKSLIVQDYSTQDIQDTEPRISRNIASITRTWRTLSGNNHISVGDIVKVNIDLQVEEGVSYLMIDDPLPAGFEALNMDVSAHQELLDFHLSGHDRGFSQFRPDYTEMHQDRVLAFKEYLWKGVWRFSYYARAVSAGSYMARPASALPMYNPEQSIESSSTRIEIKR